MFTESDYLTHEVLNEFETEIKNLYTKYKLSYTKKTWVYAELVHVKNIKKIEDAIDKLGELFGYPEKFIKKREWVETAINEISYIDLNRWYHNINLIKRGEFNPLVPREDLLPIDGRLYPDANSYPAFNKYMKVYNPLLPSDKLRERR